MGTMKCAENCGEVRTEVASEKHSELQTPSIKEHQILEVSRLLLHSNDANMKRCSKEK